MHLNEKGFAGSKPSVFPSFKEVPTPFTLVYEFNVAAERAQALYHAVFIRAQELRNFPEFVGGSLKHMQGLSTMVKNYPARYKGVLASVYNGDNVDPELPAPYVLFWRFSSGFVDCNETAWFERAIVPWIEVGPAAGAPGPKYYQGIFQTLAAATRTRSVLISNDIVNYMAEPAELEFPQAVTVLNHVLVRIESAKQFDGNVSKLLTTAQSIFRPDGGSREEGMPGAPGNDFYCRPFSTEILRGEPDSSGLVPYLMHGIWPSVCDHENSHLDERFRKASAPLAPAIVEGPEEPVYRTEFVGSYK